MTAAVLPGVRLTPRHVTQRAVPERHAALAPWEALMGAPATGQPHFLLLADPFRFHPEPLLNGLDRVYPAAHADLYDQVACCALRVGEFGHDPAYHLSWHRIDRRFARRNR